MSETVAVADFHAPQSVSYCIDLATRDRQVLANCLRVPGRLQAHSDREGRIAVVAYGPSLHDTWAELRSFDTILTCSGAHRFLLERGIVPTWHMEVDPRPHKADLIDRPHPDVEYLIASVCHERVFDLLRDFRVKLFHIFSHESARKGIPVSIPRGEWALTGGTNVGIRALTMARFLGFRAMTVFGLDFSFAQDGTQHAGWHPKEHPHIHAVEVNGELFYTNPPMHSYATEFFEEVVKLGRLDLEIRGHGLLQAQLQAKGGVARLPWKEQSMIAATSPETISAAYLAHNRTLHQTNPAYGTSGSKRVEVVKKLLASVKPATVLDYGCGKSTLAAALPIPIWEYDPAIPGKDTPPRPAELVICTDVLEHVEPEYLEAVLLDLSRCTQKVCYVVVHLGPAAKQLPDGRNAHLIQESPEWWRERLATVFTVAKMDATDTEATFVLGPRPRTAPVAVPAPDISQRVTPARYRGTEVRFKTPNEQTQWRARTLFTKEPCTIDWIETFQPGEVLWDVGANVGGYAVWASARKQVEVYAFEPEASNYALLCENFRLNQTKGLAYSLAITDTPRLDSLYLSKPQAGGSCHSFGQAVGPTLQPREGVRQGAVGMTLDQLSDILPLPHHLKIDVDGMEHQVLAGGKRLLEHVQTILVEVNASVPDHHRMIEALESYGFQYDAAQVAASTRKDGPFKGCAEYIFTRLSPVERAVLRVIAETPLTLTPFPHLQIDEFFPPDYFATIPWPTDGYGLLSDVRGTTGYPDRSVCAAPPELAWMRSGRLRKALDAKFGVTSSADETLMLRDAPGYTISPHTDTPSKAVTALIYVGGTPHGTSLYMPKITGFTDPKGAHHDRKQFLMVGRSSGTPNSALIFARTDNSFHGTEVYEGPGLRETLLYDSRR